uniref:Protein RMD5 homolog A-like n=1 Tax=Phallusia mammillata TaxID=59560 RepID=A0A6F9DQ85_9ASCI|nr:protein RMD5 homolog A-like [Phallusia mammillata]
MEGCFTIEKDIDKLLGKFESHSQQNSQTLEQLRDQVAKLREELSQTDGNVAMAPLQRTSVLQNIKKIRTSGQKLSSQHKDLHSSVSRIGKSIEKNFDPDCSSANMPEILANDSQHKMLNKAVCEHFYRQGSLTVAESIAKEGCLEIDENWRKPFVEMNDILKSLRNKEVDHALDWARRNQERLSMDKSDLEFKLHRLKFIQLLRNGSSHQSEALQYARQFQRFVPEHSKEIQKLMGCFLYIKQGLDKSPYASLLTDNVWDEIYTAFAQDACRMMGMSVESPLMSSFTAGCQALPALLAIKSVIEQRQCSGILSNNDELPIDIDLDSSQQYHSVFACPILRQSTTLKNPPLRLVCGHVISKDALSKLVSGFKVKCPYCPVEQSPNEAKEVHF